ncbi:hypothetical protein CEJ63_21195, partial [Acinetobacter baumannii]
PAAEHPGSLAGPGRAGGDAGDRLRGPVPAGVGGALVGANLGWHSANQGWRLPGFRCRIRVNTLTRRPYNGRLDQGVTT